MESPPDRLARWDRASRIPLVALGALFVVGYAAFVLGTELPAALRALAQAVVALTWLAFAVDYAVRLALAGRGSRWRYVLGHPLELLAVLLPVFRALRVVDLVRRLPALRTGSGSAIRAGIVVGAAVWATVFVLFIALSTLLVERDAPGATITDLGDALWWACVTLATVGYGDVYPVTGLGRLLAVVLMLGGIVIIGVTSGTVVSAIAERVRAGGSGGAAGAGGERAPAP